MGARLAMAGTHPQDHPRGPRTHLDGFVLGGQLPLQLGDLVGGGFLQLLQRALEVLDVLQEPQDLPVLGGQSCLQPRP